MYFSISESTLLKYNKNMRLESYITRNISSALILELESSNFLECSISWNIRKGFSRENINFFLILGLESSIPWNIGTFFGSDFLSRPCKLHLAATWLVDLPFLSSCKALYFFQSNLNVPSLCSHLKLEFCDVVKWNKINKHKIECLVLAKI